MIKVSESAPLQIKDWSSQDRPREKLLQKGPSGLTDAELIAVIVRSGTMNISAVELGKRLIQRSGDDLNELARLSIKELMKIKGMGEAKAISVVAALELSRRRDTTKSESRLRVIGSYAAYELLRADMMDLPREEFWVILLNRANLVIKKQCVSVGGVTGTVADPKIIFKLALEELASYVILAHNHPSGNLSPSYEDIELTKKMKAAGSMLEITVLDHLIIAGRKYFSFADDGQL